VSDLFCDGLGACIGTCPEGAISVTEREAVPYDEKTVMTNIAGHGAPVIKAHLEHLAGHGQTDLHNQAMEYLIENGTPIPDHTAPERRKPSAHPCTGQPVWRYLTEIQTVLHRFPFFLVNLSSDNIHQRVHSFIVCAKYLTSLMVRLYTPLRVRCVKADPPGRAGCRKEETPHEIIQASRPDHRSLLVCSHGYGTFGCRSRSRPGYEPGTH